MRLIAPNDPLWDELTRRAALARDTPRLWLEMDGIYGDLGGAPRFADAFDRWLSRIHRDGMHAAIQQYLKGE